MSLNECHEPPMEAEVKVTGISTSRQILEFDAYSEFLQNGQCSSCRTYFSEDVRPKRLDCFHVFCQKCLNVDYKDGSVMCAIILCPEKTTTDKVERLPTDNLLISRGKMRMVQNSPNDIKCQGCSNDMKAEYVCSDCQGFLCNACMNIHKSDFASRSHILYLLRDISTDILKNLFYPKLKCSKPKHENLVKSIFCMDSGCKELICLQCAVSDHLKLGHEILEDTEAFTEYETSLKEKNKMIEGETSEIQSAMLLVKLELAAIDSKQKEVENKINETFIRNQEILTEQKNKLIEDVRSLINQKKLILNEQSAVLAARDMKGATLHEYTESALRSKSSALGVSRELVSKLEGLLNSDRKTKLRSKADFSFEASKKYGDFQELAKNLWFLKNERTEFEKEHAPGMHDFHDNADENDSKDERDTMVCDQFEGASLIKEYSGPSTGYVGGAKIEEHVIKDEQPMKRQKTIHKLSGTSMFGSAEFKPENSVPDICKI